jgi:hypothetical protein
MEMMAPLEHEARMEFREPRAQRAHKAHRVRLEHKVSKEQRVHKEQRAHKEQREKVVRMALMENKEGMVLMVKRVQLAQEASKE